jgi:hypothetical protein
MQHTSILAEHVELFDARNGLHVELLEGRLELAVVLSPRRLGRFYHLATYCSFAACSTTWAREWGRVQDDGEAVTSSKDTQHKHIV